MHMRPSRVLRKLRAGQPAFSFKLNLGSARAVELTASYGFDCIWLCQEHVGTDWTELEHQIRGAKLLDSDPMVRVAKGCYSDYIRPLELDASGIMIPHVMSADETREIVKTCRFHPMGRRPLDGGNEDGFYCRLPMMDYIAQANRERFLCLQIEDPEAVEELEAIAAVPGYDILFFGPGDYAHALGKAGDLNCAEVESVRKRLAAAARKHGKFAGTVGSVQSLPGLLEQGYTFINLGSDVGIYRTQCQEIANGLIPYGGGMPAIQPGKSGKSAYT